MTPIETETAPACTECTTPMQRAGGHRLYWTCRWCGTAERVAA